MDNNSILRRLRFSFNFNDAKMMELFALGNRETSRADISNWLKRDTDEDFIEMADVELAAFLNGFIIERRGVQEGKEPVAEEKLNNNMIFRKLKIALNLKSEDICDIFELVNKRISESEVGSFLRNYKHSKYRAFNGQYLRNFMNGIQAKYRGEE